MFETKEISDSLSSAYLRTLNFSIRPKLVNNKIVFVISGENLTEAIETLYSNPKVRILDFISAYKEMRSMIFNLRKTGGMTL